MLVAATALGATGRVGSDEVATFVSRHPFVRVAECNDTACKDKYEENPRFQRYHKQEKKLHHRVVITYWSWNESHDQVHEGEYDRRDRECTDFTPITLCHFWHIDHLLKWKQLNCHILKIGVELCFVVFAKCGMWPGTTLKSSPVQSDTVLASLWHCTWTASHPGVRNFYLKVLKVKLAINYCV